MWLARLDLIAFGHFTDVQLPLGRGLHLIYGPNEAGKTTALRAIRQLLFGIDERTTDNFVHQNPNLRIGGVVRNQAGVELEVVRRKARKDSLQTADESSTIDVEVWQSVLCGIDEATFSSRYGIDYHQLVKGGEEIAQGTGDLGEILFATGSGVADLTSIQQSLRDEAGALFKPQGKKQRLNEALIEWQKQKDLLSKSMLLVADWEALDQRRQKIQQDLDSVVEILDAQIATRDQYRNLQKSWSLVQELDKLQIELKPSESICRLPEDFGATRQDALLQLKQATSQTQSAMAAMTRAERDLRSLTVPHEFLERTSEITQFITDWGLHHKALQDRPQLMTEFTLHDQRCSELAPRLGQIDAVVVTTGIDRAKRIGVNQLGRQQAGLVQAIQQTEARRGQLQQQITTLRAKLAGLPVVPASETLREAVRQAQRTVDLEPQLVKVNQRVSAIQSELQSQREQLGLKRASIEFVRSARTPTMESLKNWEADFQIVERKLAIESSRLEEMQADYQKQRAQLVERQQVSNLPTEDELQLARRQRDETLAEIQTEVGRNQVPAMSLTDRLEALIRESDQMVDRICNDATRFAEIATITEDLRTSEVRQRELSALIENQRGELADLSRRWQAAWPDLANPAGSPREMQTWLARRDALLQSDAQMAQHTSEATELRQRIEKHRSQLIKSLEPSGPLVDSAVALAASVPVNRQQLSFGWEEESASAAPNSTNGSVNCDGLSMLELLSLAEERLDRDDANRQDRIDTEETLERAVAEQLQVTEQAAAARVALEKWQSDWETALAALGLEVTLSPDTADAYLETLSEYIEHQRQADQFQKRISDIDREAEQFASQVTAFCEETAPDLAKLPTRTAIETLRERMLVGQQDLKKYNVLTEQKRQAERQLEQAREWRQRGKTLIEQLCRAVKLECPPQESFEDDSEPLQSTLQRLADLELAGKLRGEREAQLALIENQLTILAGDVPLLEFVELVRRSPHEDLAPRISAMEAECQRLAKERDRLQAEVGNYNGQLQRIDGSSAAAEIEEKQRQLLAQIRSDVEQYARIKLAGSILHTAVEKYRDKIRGPVLSIASELFRELTLGSFDGLRITEDNEGQPALVGLRNDGQTHVTAHAMSEGTCDQLYLALRVASLLLEQPPRNQLPFIVDDILIQFDDARSAAALRVLARLGQQRQVIFFTHHEHLLEIAEQHVAGNYTTLRL